MKINYHRIPERKKSNDPRFNHIPSPYIKALRSHHLPQDLAEAYKISHNTVAEDRRALLGGKQSKGRPKERKFFQQVETQSGKPIPENYFQAITDLDLTELEIGRAYTIRDTTVRMDRRNHEAQVRKSEPYKRDLKILMPAEEIAKIHGIKITAVKEDRKNLEIEYERDLQEEEKSYSELAVKYLKNISTIKKERAELREKA